MDTCREPSDPRNTAPIWMRPGIFREHGSAKKYDEQSARDIMDLYRSGVRQTAIARLVGCSISHVRCVVSERVVAV